MRAKIEELKQPTIAEIKSYSDPPASVGDVIKATFLLLGESFNDLQVYIRSSLKRYSLKPSSFFRNGKISVYFWVKWARNGS